MVLEHLLPKGPCVKHCMSRHEQCEVPAATSFRPISDFTE
jgi:hypothetical protein